MDSACTTGIEKEKQIKNQINLLAGAREILTEKLITLSAQLSPALRGEQTHEEKGENVPAESLVEIAVNIREVRYYIESDTRTIMDILDRLEI